MHATNIKLFILFRKTNDVVFLYYVPCKVLNVGKNLNYEKIVV
jgi:hypothetical protein